jgi:hypothetical protein
MVGPGAEQLVDHVAGGVGIRAGGEEAGDGGGFRAGGKDGWFGDGRLSGRGGGAGLAEADGGEQAVAEAFAALGAFDGAALGDVGVGRFRRAAVIERAVGAAEGFA